MVNIDTRFASVVLESGIIEGDMIVLEALDWDGVYCVLLVL